MPMLPFSVSVNVSSMVLIRTNHSNLRHTIPFYRGHSERKQVFWHWWLSRTGLRGEVPSCFVMAIEAIGEARAKSVKALQLIEDRIAIGEQEDVEKRLRTLAANGRELQQRSHALLQRFGQARKRHRHLEQEMGPPPMTMNRPISTKSRLLCLHRRRHDQQS
eukprot:6381462-Amphidinium_carterae.2